MPVSPRTCRGRGRVRSAEVKVRDEQGGPAETHAVPRPAEPQHDAHGARVLVAMHGVPFATAVRRQPAFGSQVSVVHGLLSAQLIGVPGCLAGRRRRGRPRRRRRGCRRCTTRRPSPACDSSSSSGCTGSSRARPRLTGGRAGRRSARGARIGSRARRPRRPPAPRMESEIGAPRRARWRRSGGRVGAGGRGRRAARADRLRARRGEGMPPRLPILASRAPRQPQRPPAGRGRARRLRGSPRRHPLPAPGPRGDSLRPALAGAPGPAPPPTPAPHRVFAGELLARID